MTNTSSLTISVIGAGAWGTTLAKVLADNWPDKEIALWARSPETKMAIQETRENKARLLGVKLPANIYPTNSLREAIRRMDVVIFSVPSNHITPVLEEACRYFDRASITLNTAKGFVFDSHQGLCKFSSEVFKSFVCSKKEYAVLSGPSFAYEVAEGKLTRLVAASMNDEQAEVVRDIFSNDYLALEISNDVRGVEFCAAIKNVIAIAVGMADGLVFGDNSKAVLATKGIEEIERLGMAMGVDHETLRGPAGFGDLILTTMGKQSRNAELGRRIAQGEKLSEVLSSLRGVAEGVESVRGAMELARRKGLAMPVSKAVYEIVYGNASPHDTIYDLVMH